MANDWANTGAIAGMNQQESHNSQMATEEMARQQQQMQMDTQLQALEEAKYKAKQNEAYRPTQDQENLSKLAQAKDSAYKYTDDLKDREEIDLLHDAGLAAQYGSEDEYAQVLKRMPDELQGALGRIPPSKRLGAIGEIMGSVAGSTLDTQRGGVAQEQKGAQARETAGEAHGAAQTRAETAVGGAKDVAGITAATSRENTKASVAAKDRASKRGTGMNAMLDDLRKAGMEDEALKLETAILEAEAAARYAKARTGPSFAKSELEKGKLSTDIMQSHVQNMVSDMSGADLPGWDWNKEEVSEPDFYMKIKGHKQVQARALQMVENQVPRDQIQKWIGANFVYAGENAGVVELPTDEKGAPHIVNFAGAGKPEKLGTVDADFLMRMAKAQDIPMHQAVMNYRGLLISQGKIKANEWTF